MYHISYRPFLFVISFLWLLAACQNDSPDIVSDSTKSSEIVASDPLSLNTGANQPPIANAGDYSFVEINVAVTLNGERSRDPEGGQLAYRWTLVDGPGENSASFELVDTAKPTFTPYIAGEYTIHLIVSDGLSDSVVSETKVRALPPVIGTVVTTLKISNSTDTTIQTDNVPVSFGQVFRKADIPAGKTLAARTSIGGVLPLQIDRKANYPDGSLKHAVLSTILPVKASSESVLLELVANSNSTMNGALQANTLHSDFNVVLTTNIDGTHYSASARHLLETTSPKLWLDGPLVAEWQVAGPLMNGDQEHPHLTARFYIRAYAGMDNIRVSVVLENNWTWQPNPSNFVYDLSIDLNGEQVFSEAGLNHHGHARWRKVFWTGVGKDIHVAHDVDYLMSTKAVPNYDRSVVPSQSKIDADYQAVTSGIGDYGLPRYGTMGHGLWRVYFPGTGAHSQIGPLPNWTALYLLSQNETAKKTEIINAEQAGIYPIHFRDKNTDLPVSIVDYPNITTHGNLAHTAGFIPRNNGTPSNMSVDTAHAPSIAFVPYLLTGDYFFLEELQFWANSKSFNTAPSNRQYDEGLIKWQQVRGQAWSLRTLAQAAYATPDNHPLKAYFTTIVNNNLDWYSSSYEPSGAYENQLGILRSGAINGDGIALWQDDFVTWAVNYTFDLGFVNAESFAKFKATFPVSRMNGPGYCWNEAAAYGLQFRNPGSAPYTTIAELWNANFSQPATDCTLSYINGYPDSPTGYPSNLQPALAAAADRGLRGAAEAWQRFESRSIQPNYSSMPVWAVMPRKVRN